MRPFVVRVPNRKGGSVMDWKEHKGMIYVFIAFMLIMSFFASLSYAGFVVGYTEDTLHPLTTTLGVYGSVELGKSARVFSTQEIRAECENVYYYLWVYEKHDMSSGPNNAYLVYAITDETGYPLGDPVGGATLAYETFVPASHIDKVGTYSAVVAYSCALADGGLGYFLDPQGYPIIPGDSNKITKLIKDFTVVDSILPTPDACPLISEGCPDCFVLFDLDEAWCQCKPVANDPNDGVCNAPCESSSSLDCQRANSCGEDESWDWSLLGCVPKTNYCQGTHFDMGMGIYALKTGGYVRGDPTEFVMADVPFSYELKPVCAYDWIIPTWQVLVGLGGVLVAMAFMRRRRR